MPLSNKKLESIEEKDLQALKENKVLERKRIEYKVSLPGSKDSDKKEFLGDVSSFANATGGDLIYGIRAEAGVPKEVCGLQDINVDDSKLRLEEIIRSGIAPRIPGISIWPVPLQNSRHVIIIRIPRSYLAPHMVTYQGSSRFYSRNSAGKYLLDVDELRTAFVLSETTTERIRNFRINRLGRIISGETPIALRDEPKLVLHIVPFGAFDPKSTLDLSSLTLAHKAIRHLKPIQVSSPRGRHNFDGFLTYGGITPSGSFSYVQLFRNGSIEVVRCYLRRGTENIIASQAYEKELLEALPGYLSSQEQLGIEPPLFIMLSLLGVRGYTMAVNTDRFWFLDEEDIHPIDRDDLLVPEVIVESLDCDFRKAAEIMRPVFDTIWNAAGWPRSMNYNEAGEWVGQ